MRMTKAALAEAIATPGFNWRQFGQQYGRDGNRIGPGRRTIDSLFSGHSHTYSTMRRPPNAGRHYDDYVVGRQMKRFLARITAKAVRHKAYLDSRRHALSGRKAVAAENV